MKEGNEMSDKVEISGIEIKINGKPVVLKMEAARARYVNHVITILPIQQRRSIFRIPREAIRILRGNKMSDEIKVTGLEIKIDGKKRTLTYTWDNTTNSGTSGGFHCEGIDEETINLIGQF